MKSDSVKLLELMDALPDRRSWRDEAMCLGRDPSDFYVANLNPSVRRQQAKELCAGCPVERECEEDAQRTFSVSDLLGFNEVGATLETVGVVRGGKVW